MGRAVRLQRAALFVDGQHRRAHVARVKRNLVLLLLSLLCIAPVTHSKRAKPGGGTIPVNSRTWCLYHRDYTCDAPTDVPGGGIAFLFSESPLPDPDATPPWDGYLLSAQKNRALSGTLVARFMVGSEDGVVWNFKSDPENNGTSPAAFRLYFQRGAALYAGSYRWWSNPIHHVMASSDGIFEMRVPLTPDQWSDVDGHKGDSDNFHRALFAETLTGVHFIGGTFGGGQFFGKGISTSNGTAQFTLSSYSVE